MASRMSAFSSSLSFLFLLISLHFVGATTSSGDIENEGIRALVIENLLKASNSKRMPNLSDPATFQSINLDFQNNWSGERSATTVRFQLQPEAEPLRPSGREISLMGHSHVGHWNRTKIETAFELLNNLETVHWYVQRPISTTILRSLEAICPPVKLDYSLHFENRDLCYNIYNQSGAGDINPFSTCPISVP